MKNIHYFYFLINIQYLFLLSEIKCNIYIKEQNNLLNLRNLQSVCSLTITINGPLENAQIIGSTYSYKPKYIYLNDDRTTNLYQSDKLNLEKEGENIITMEWDSNPKSTVGMFKSCSSIISIDLSNFDSSSITSMNNMFADCKSLVSINFSNFNTNKVKTMSNIFKNCFSLISLDLTSFTTDKANTMENMFNGCYSLQYLDISSFVTSSVANMNSMFKSCNSLLSLDLFNINTSSVVNMNEMFENCTSLQSLYITNFDTDKVSNMHKMFCSCTNLISLDITNFDTSIVTNMNSMFKDCSSLTSLNLLNFNTNLVNNMEYMFFGCSSLSELDLSSFHTDSLQIMDHLFNGCKSLTSLDISNFNTEAIKNLNYVFKECSSLKSLDLSNFDTSLVNTMKGMFLTCSSLESVDISSYNLSSTTDISELFMNCISLQFVNLTNLNVLSVNKKNNIFKNCSSINSLDLTNCEIGNLEDIFGDISAISITNRTTQSVREIIDNLDQIMENRNPSSTYVLGGDDFEMIIKPINQYVEDSSVNIYFSECEAILKEENPSKNYTILQINMKNNNKNCIVDQVEYKVYDETNQPVDLSVCENVDIKIEYKIVDPSSLNLEQISNFKNLGIDIFNLKENFFNDICFPYSDSGSNSDMILSDRVSDIYQNYSICGANCQYESFDIDKVVANCNCKLKQEVSAEIEEGNFETSIESAFLDSNFGIIKCYNIVFGSKDKLTNVGFWIFGLMIIFHFPLYFFQFINGINPVKLYILNEMKSKGYLARKISSKRESTKIESTKEIFVNTNNKEGNPPYKNCRHLTFETSAPPRKIQKIINFGSKNDLNTVIGESNNPSKSTSENEENIIQQNLETITRTQEEKIEADKIDVRKKEKSNFSKTVRKKVKNRLSSKTDLDHLLNNNGKKYKRRFTKKSNMVNIDILEKRSEKENVEGANTKRKLNEEENKKIHTDFPLILINANNNNKNSQEILKSNYKLDNFNYDEAIKYDDRSFFRIFFIFLISKNNLLNIIYFNPPLELKPLRICVFIFDYACDLALNALFYLSKNISDKYHYEGPNRLLFSLINNLTKSLVSTITSFILLTFFQTLTQSTENITKLFRDQEDLLKKDKTYKVNDDTKIKIENDIKKILKCLKIKIIIFVIFEFLFLLFFFYYVTAFCTVYKNTQSSWILDSISSYLLSYIISLGMSLIMSIIYKISIYNKIKILYRISLMIY